MKIKNSPTFTAIIQIKNDDWLEHLKQKETVSNMLYEYEVQNRFSRLINKDGFFFTGEHHDDYLCNYLGKDDEFLKRYENEKTVLDKNGFESLINSIKSTLKLNEQSTYKVSDSALIQPLITFLKATGEQALVEKIQKPKVFFVLTGHSQSNYTIEFSKLEQMDINVKKYSKLKKALLYKYINNAQIFGKEQSDELLKVLKTALKL